MMNKEEKCIRKVYKRSEILQPDGIMGILPSLSLTSKRHIHPVEKFALLILDSEGPLMARDVEV